MKNARMIFWICLLLLPAGCSLKQPMPEIQYYTLEYNPPQFDGLAALPAVVELEPFSVRPPYDSDRIVYRDGPYKRDAYLYARWRDNPGNLVTYFFGRDMRSSGLFEAVLTDPSSVFPPFRINGSVDDFFEWDGSESWTAVLQVGLTVVSRSLSGGEAVLLQRSYRFQKICDRKNPQGLARAMSQAMSDASRIIIGDVYDHIRASGLPAKTRESTLR